MTIDLIIATLLCTSGLLFAAGRREARRKRTPWCWKHRREYRTYFSGERDCPDCVAERIAEIHGRGGNLREDI